MRTQLTCCFRCIAADPCFSWSDKHEMMVWCRTLNVRIPEYHLDDIECPWFMGKTYPWQTGKTGETAIPTETQRSMSH
jgi:hypothetical protein